MDDDGKAIKKWNAGKIKLLAAHPQSAGHGLNLQHGGHIIVYVDNPWSLERFCNSMAAWRVRARSTR